MSSCQPTFLYDPQLDAVPLNMSNCPALKIYCCFRYLLEDFPSSHMKMPYILFPQAQPDLTDTTMRLGLMANFEVLAVAI